MKIIVTKDEINRLITYLGEKQNNPCNNCCSPAERAVCCGCQKQSEYAKRINSIKPEEHILNCKVIMDYGKLKVDMSEVEKKIKALTEQLAKLNKEANMFLAEDTFEIVD